MKKVIYYIIAGAVGGILSSIVFIGFNKNNQQVTKVVYEAYPASNANVVSTNARASFASSVDFTDAAESSISAVVHVKVRNKINMSQSPLFNFLYGQPDSDQNIAPIVSTGSGVIISNDGYIVTNNHVIDGADILEVTLNDKRTFEAKVIGTDPTTDIALIKIEGEELPFLKWGNSDDLRVGEWVLAVGNPFNLSSTVTAGIVSAKSRSINIINRNTAIEAFIQTDAAVNPGNSGGALVNTKGELVGVNTAIKSPTGAFTGYSFAVPQKIAQKITADLLEYGMVQRAYIGISITDVTSETAKRLGVVSTKGVYVTAIAPDGAASDAGIKKGDIIIKVDGVEVNSTSELQEQIGRFRPGDQVTAIVKRGNKEKELLLTLKNIEGNTNVIKADKDSKFMLYGANLIKLDSELQKKLRLKGGVQVESLGDGKFKQAGIKEKFIITSINRQRVYQISDIKLIMKNSSGGIYVEGVYPNGMTAYYAFGI